MMNIKTIGIDIAKEIFQLYEVDQQGNKVLEKRIKRAKLKEYVAQLNPCRIVMEACGSANYWARQFTALGHEVKLIAPQYVKPFVKGNKNDYRDAQGIVEADSRPEMPYVEPKTVEQQDIQSLLRIREGYIEMRTKIGNQLRGLLAEYGIAIKLGRSALKQALPGLFDRDAENGLTPLMKELIENQYTTFLLFEQRIEECDVQIVEIGKRYEACQRLQAIEGIGILTAVALYATVGPRGQGFKNGRHFAAFVGLVPRQHSSGQREILLGISKRGDGHLRKLFIHGGRAVVRTAGKKTDTRSQWVQQLTERRGANRAAVAVANKNARIAIALLLHNRTYQQAA